MTSVVALHDVTMSFGTNLVLDGVRVEVQAGSVVALLGANGAGKSTLIKILSGVHVPDAGRILVDGTKVAIGSPLAARALGVETVHQVIDDGVVPGLSVAENLVFEELASRDAGALFSLRRILPRAREVAAALDLDWDERMLRRDVADLGVSDKQMLVLARALSRDPRLLILDEPTSALSAAEVERLFEVVRRLRSAGVAVVYVSHRLGEIDTLADRVVVLRDGRVQADLPRPFDWRAALFGMLGEEAAVGDLVERRAPHRRRFSSSSGGETVLRVVGARLFPDRPPIDLGLRSGEVTGVVGLLGAGKSELVRGIFGAAQFARAEGRMELAGRPYRPRRPDDAIRAGVFLVPEDRHGEALVPGWSLASNVSLPFLSSVSRRGGVLSLRRENALGRSTIEALGVLAPSESTEIEGLSGGNQQKVVIGRWLTRRPTVLLLDEPFRGVDIGARRDIGERVRRLAADGAAVLVLSSDVDEVLEVADRVLVLVDGEVRADAALGKISRNEIIDRMSEVA